MSEVFDRAYRERTADLFLAAALEGTVLPEDKVRLRCPHCGAPVRLYVFVDEAMAECTALRCEGQWDEEGPIP